MPRALGPAGVGIIVTSWSVTGVFGIVLGLGTRNYLVRELVVRPGSASRLIGAALVLRIVLAPVFAAAILIYAQIAANGYELRVALYLAAAATILTLLAEPMQAGFQAIERMEYLALFRRHQQVVAGPARRDPRADRIPQHGHRGVLDDHGRRRAHPERVLDAAAGAHPPPAQHEPARAVLGRTREHRVLGLRRLHDALPVDRHRDAVAADATRGRRLVRRPDQALPEPHVPAGADVDGVAPPSRRPPTRTAATSCSASRASRSSSCWSRASRSVR